MPSTPLRHAALALAILASLSACKPAADGAPKADATVESGSAGAVIKLLQAFKDAQKAAEAPPEQTPDDVWAEDAATSVRSSAPLKLPTRAPASDEDEYKNAWNDM